MTEHEARAVAEWIWSQIERETVLDDKEGSLAKSIIAEHLLAATREQAEAVRVLASLYVGLRKCESCDWSMDQHDADLDDYMQARADLEKCPIAKAAIDAAGGA